MSDTINSGAFAGDIPVAVFGWIADTGACGHYRVLQPLKTLAQKRQVQVEVGPKSNLPYTVLVAQRTHKPDTVEFLEHVRTNRLNVAGVDVPRIVYEIDDDLWAIEKDNPGYRYYKNNDVLPNAIRAIELSDAVTVSTQPLAEVMRKHNDNVFVLPNSIPRKYLNEIRFPYTTGQAGKPFVMGWAGSATHLNDFRQAAPGLNAFMKLYPNSRMVFFGTDYSELLDASVRDQCRQAPWTSTVPGYLNLLSQAQIDVMLAPLAPSTFNESKSNLRLIEANALGIPVIATDWGPYKFVAIDEATHSGGVRYITPGQSWLAALADLASTPFERMNMSARGREWVEKHFVMENNMDLWLDAYKAVLDV